MTSFVATFILIVLSFAALIAQEFIPPLYGFGMARVQIVPLLFCYGAISLSSPYMIVLAFCSGGMLDLLNLQMVGGQPEIAFGTTTCFFLVVGMICQGIRSLFLEGQWWLLGVMAGVSTSALLLMQFVLISFRRFDHGGMEWSETVFWRILVPGIIAFLLAPIFQAAVYFLNIFLFPLSKSRGRYPFK